MTEEGKKYVSLNSGLLSEKTPYMYIYIERERKREKILYFCEMGSWHSWPYNSHVNISLSKALKRPKHNKRQNNNIAKHKSLYKCNN